MERPVFRPADARGSEDPPPFTLFLFVVRCYLRVVERPGESGPSLTGSSPLVATTTTITTTAAATAQNHGFLKTEPSRRFGAAGVDDVVAPKRATGAVTAGAFAPGAGALSATAIWWRSEGAGGVGDPCA